MANLKRYRYFEGNHPACMCDLAVHNHGEYVKFDDIKDFLPSTSTNTEIPKFPSLEEVRGAYVSYWGSQDVAVNASGINGLLYAYDFIAGKLR